MNTTEHQVQAQILDFLKINSKVAWVERMNTGATISHYKGKKRFIRFSFKGCSDIIGQLKNGRFFAIEVKKPEYYKNGEKKDCRKKLSQEQAEFISTVGKNGGLAIVADDLVILKKIFDAVEL